MKRLTGLGAFDTLPYECHGAARRELGVRRDELKALLGRWAGWLVLGAGLAGCAAISVDSPPEEKAKLVATRAAARWELLLKGDVDGAYGFLSAGSKAAMPLAVYKAKIRAGMWRKADVDKVTCEAEICKVEMLITYDFKKMKGIQTRIPESWIIENGSVWYVFR